MADDPLALLTRQEAYEAINDAETAAQASSPRDDEMIGIWVPALSRRVDDLCGPVVIRTVADERHDGGDLVVRLDESPAASITSLVEYRHGVAFPLTAEQDTDLPEDGFLLERVGTSSFVHRRCSGHDGRFAHGRQNVKVTYEAGRSATTGTVDPLFKMAAAAILRRLWSREAGAWAVGGDPFTEAGMSPGFFKTVDPMVREFLSDEMRTPASA